MCAVTVAAVAGLAGFGTAGVASAAPARTTLENQEVISVEALTPAATAATTTPKVKPDVTVGPGTTIYVLNKKITATRYEASRCTIAFNARTRKGVQVSITAGHCGNAGKQVAVGKYIVGEIVKSSNRSAANPNATAGHPDYGIIVFHPKVKFRSAMHSVRVTYAAKARVGDRVCTFGSTSGYICGKVIQVQPQYIQSTMKVRKGDSGGPIFRPSDNAALGIVSFAIIRKRGSTRALSSVAYSILPVLNSFGLTLSTN